MRTSLRLTLATLGVFGLVLGCSKTPEPQPEPKPEPKKEETPAPPATPAGESPAGGGGKSTATQGEKVGSDPLKGNWTMADASKLVPGTGTLVAKIDTGKGAIQCKLLDDKAPITVANFIGLATGKRTWRDPKSGQWVNKPAYDGTNFHRTIQGFMIQGGDPNGDGSGEPGYVIKDEIWAGAKHDRAGLLCMANRGHNTNGAQFFITDDAAAHLDNNYTIFGECEPVSTVHEIAKGEVHGDKAVNPVTIKTVTISRDEKKK